MAFEKVLLVDDEKDFTDMLSARLQKRGLTVFVANDGASALEVSKDHNLDAVILDLQMPGMDGIETLKKLTQKDPDIQVILLTGHATLQKGVEAMKEGAMDFLEKPVDIKELMERIGQAATKHTVLMEQRNAERIEKLMSEKGW